ncbi:hypothetical protein [Bacillus pseudomycoides]|uniref:hypothetical protein n=1 Tax=Bacillus pseudomycoides TaxID=64104 RepID=UPI000BF08F35|nr:hypothetical protein [Bacillus pseudomycoides]PEK65950.1 hypothetical protein CN590_17600 [Bacillus pseudomycoides]
MNVYKMIYVLDGILHIQPEKPEDAQEIAYDILDKFKRNPSFTFIPTLNVWNVTEDDIYVEEEENKRVCNVCRQGMVEGYCIDDGLAYYCSEECLHKEYTPEEYEEMYEDDYAYWTQWEE